MKKVISIFLILTITTEIISVPFIFVYIKHQIKREFRSFLKENKLNSNAIEKIFIDKETLNNKTSFHQTDDDEFKYLGKMYDVVRKDVCKDGIAFHCINDSKEDLLIQQFQNYFNENDNQPKSQFSNLIKICLKLLIQEYIEVYLQKYIFDFKKDFMIYPILYFINYFPDIFTPPPEL